MGDPAKQERPKRKIDQMDHPAIWSHRFNSGITGTFVQKVIYRQTDLCQLKPMPRLARLDAPGILHHVIGRGIERKKIFYNDTDRSDFIDRLAALAEEGAMDVHAWVLMPNHYHILCRTRNPCHRVCAKF